MNMIYIYGPPGVGKYTVSKELSKLTGYRLFHNQLSIEFVMSMFDFGTPTFNRLVLKYRADMIEEAAKNGISLIFTSSYAKGFNDPIIKDIMKRVRKHNGNVYFVQLHCETGELLKRVTSGSRRKYYKIRSSKLLKNLMKKYNHTSSIPFVKSLYIDNTKIKPKEAAKKIIRYYNLQ